MKKLTGSLSSIWFICAILINSCDKEPSNNSNSIEVNDSCSVDGQIITGYDTLPIEPCVDINFGPIDLSPCSFKSIPYKNDTNLVFQDSLDNEVILVLQKIGPQYTDSERRLYCNGDTAFQYTIEGQYQVLSFYIYSNDNEHDFDFLIYLFVNYYMLTTNELIFKESINVVSFDSNGDELNHTKICLYPEDPHFVENRSVFYPEKSLNDELFQYVYGSWENELFYNYKYGLIGFRDDKQKLWVLKAE